MAKMQVILRLLAGVLGVAEIICSLCLVTIACGYNRLLYAIDRYDLIAISEFPYYDSEYKKRVPVHQMDLYHINNEIHGVGSMSKGWYFDEWTIELKSDICYYSEPDKSAEIVKRITKGTTVYVTYDIATYYGLHSYPTYEGGWRYALPLTEYGTEDSDRIYGTNGAYVRSEDLYSVVKAAYSTKERTAWLSASQERAKEMFEAPGRLFTRRFMIKWLYLYHDAELHSSGYYTSPDLYREPFNATTITLLSTGTALIILQIILNHRRKLREQNKT